MNAPGTVSNMENSERLLGVGSSEDRLKTDGGVIWKDAGGKDRVKSSFHGCQA